MAFITAKAFLLYCTDHLKPKWNIMTWYTAIQHRTMSCLHYIQAASPTGSRCCFYDEFYFLFPPNNMFPHYIEMASNWSIFLQHHHTNTLPFFCFLWLPTDSISPLLPESNILGFFQMLLNLWRKYVLPCWQIKSNLKLLFLKLVLH